MKRILLAALMFATIPLPALSADQDRLREIQQTLERQQERLEQQQRLLEKQQEAIKALRQRRDKPGEAAPDGLAETETEEEPEEGHTEISGYGVIKYLQYDWETVPDKRDAVDVERFILEIEHEFNEDWELEAEIEFEHGGTGVTKELDRREEFGEFETEVEAGGEVVIEELHITYRPWKALGFRVGEMIVPVGLINAGHRPQQYLSVRRPIAETALIPVTWHETGIAVLGQYGPLSYQAMVVSGLDSTGFSQRRFIATGKQGSFEMTRAEGLAFAGRLDYEVIDGLVVGGSLYSGESNTNRPKPDLDDVDGTVTVWDVHGVLRRAGWTVRALYLAGSVENSDRITQANKSLSNSLGAPRTAVGSEAQSASLAVAYNILPFLDVIPGFRLEPFVRVAAYDSQSETEGSVPNDPFSERDEWTVGINYQVLESIIFKADFTHRERGNAQDNVEETLAVGFGFTF